MNNSSSSSSSSSSASQNWLAFSLSNNPNSLSLFHHHPNSTDLSIFSPTAAPKLEDFLRGASNPPPPSPPPFHFSSHQSEICDSDLKTIAASFLRGPPTTHFPEQHFQHLHAPPPPPPPTQSDTSPPPPPKKAVDTFGQRTSIYRGVTRHRWTGRYEAHLWDNSCRREGQSRKGRQVYLGGYDKEEKAARAYDLAALKYWGPTTTTNFPVSNYEKELDDMKNMTRQEFVASLRRRSSGFSRGASIYRGVTRHHQHGRWQARIGRVAGNKDLYLGTFSTQEEAAEAYDIAAIKFRGLNAVTNFDISRYDVKSIASSNLPIGGMSGTKSKTTSDSAPSDGGSRSTEERDVHHSPASSTVQPNNNSSSTLSFTMPIKQDPSDQYWSILGYNNPSSYNTSLVKPDDVPPSSSRFQQPGSTMFPAITDLASSGSTLTEGGMYGGMYVQQQQYATPVALSSGISIEIGQSMRGFEGHTKPSLFQTPIFGME
ncbi:AP2-like ethylene-responsive transcription factor AIL5 [Benincasa hispida]|uniref:AP2-like ethylene-responsive transcription factor AIL5 n=1 Tax=Benincasa hispida TaxID=102211 RepID=UPI0019008F34|nr:AP2-like ethylene-responsive transcription factor AIL5 [Benincasa hispida]